MATFGFSLPIPYLPFPVSDSLCSQFRVQKGRIWLEDILMCQVTGHRPAYEISLPCGQCPALIPPTVDGWAGSYKTVPYASLPLSSQQGQWKRQFALVAKAIRKSSCSSLGGKSRLRHPTFPADEKSNWLFNLGHSRKSRWTSLPYWTKYSNREK